MALKIKLIRASRWIKIFTISPPEEATDIPTVCHSLEQALDCLRADCAFLLEGGVFTRDMINAYIALKEREINLIRTWTHPLEFELYYSV